jgi:hypothetical protein
MTRESGDKETIARFTARITAPLFLWGLTIPGAFVLMTNTNVQIPGRVSELIVYPLSFVWPVMQENWIVMKKEGYELNAANYVGFVGLVLLLGILGFVRIGREYKKSRGAITFDLMSVGLIMFFWPFLYFGASHWDRVVFEFKSLSNFYMDPHGLFYIREYIILIAPYLPLLVLFASIIRGFDRIRTGYPSHGTDQ